MLDPGLLLSLFGGTNKGVPSNIPMISGGGFGGGQTGSGGFLSNLFGGNPSSPGSTGGFNPSSLFSFAGDLGSNAIIKNNTDKNGIISDGDAKLAGAVSGMGKGAAIGSIIPGVGTLLGGGIGGVLGALFGQGNEVDINKIQNEQANERLDMMSQATTNRGEAIANAFNTDGYETAGYYKNGGHVLPSYKVEDGEVLYASSSNPPMTDNNGTAKQIGQNTFKFEGDKHSDPSGGIGVEGGNTPFLGNDGQPESTGFVFSNKLKSDPLKYLAHL